MNRLLTTSLIALLASDVVADTPASILERLDCINAQLFAHRDSLQAPIELIQKVVGPIPALPRTTRFATFPGASVELPPHFSNRVVTLGYNITTQIDTNDPSHGNYLILTAYVNGKEIQPMRTLDTGRYQAHGVTITTRLPSSDDPIKVQIWYRSPIGAPKTNTDDWKTVLLQIAAPAVPEWPTEECGLGQ